MDSDTVRLAYEILEPSKAAVLRVTRPDGTTWILKVLASVVSVDDMQQTNPLTGAPALAVRSAIFLDVQPEKK
jgi:hypothetical protein